MMVLMPAMVRSSCGVRSIVCVKFVVQGWFRSACDAPQSCYVSSFVVLPVEPGAAGARLERLAVTT